MEKRNPTSAQTQSQAAGQQSPSLAVSGLKKSSNIPASDGPAVRSRNSATGIKKSNSSNSQGPNGSSTFNENDTFNKHYNKELRVSKDEIPIVLAELNDSSIAFIKREQYEKALNLLQKAYGIMDVVEFNLCRRDKFHLFILFHNMALCYQKMQMLDECAQCIEQALEFLPLDQFNLQEKSISNRMRKLQILGKLKLQYCAILSQVHRHKDALHEAKEGVKISHLLINDMKQLCEFYIKREDIEQSIIVNNNNSISISRNDGKEADLNYNSIYSQNYGSKKINSSRNRSFSQFLSQQEAYSGEDLKPSSNMGFHKRNDSFSNNNLSSFYSLNYLEESMSFIERTARKLRPILVELKKKMIPEKSIRSEVNKSKGKIETLEESLRDDLDSDDEIGTYNDNAVKKLPIDMKNILGYLNQGEWTQTLSIGSIMQLQPFTMRELLEQGKNELELTRESFIAKVSFLAVSYFCYSTEIRFILQMKEDPSYDPIVKQKESEFWHAKALEIACTFLPGECPLLNHINLSYQKHFAPVKTTILEDEANNDDLIVVKPLQGIDNPKFQPIIRQVQNIQIAITPYQMTPINQIANQFLSQMISFNDYQEQQNQSQNPSSYGTKMQHQKSKSGGDLTGKRSLVSNTNRPGSKAPYDSLIDDNKQQQSISHFDEQDDLKKFEELFEKLMRENKIDKNDLLKKLKLTQDRTGYAMLDEADSSQFNDILLDEHILAEESIDDEQIAIEAKHQNSNSINLYKFRGNERPKTSHSIHRLNNNSIGGGDQIPSDLEKEKTSINQDSKSSFTKQQLQQIEDSKKRSQRPLSGGLQKIKNESHRSRINKINHNYSMYEKFGSSNTNIVQGFSPEKNMQLQNLNSKNQGNQLSNYNTYQNHGITSQSYSQNHLKKGTQNKSFDAYQKPGYIPSNQPLPNQTSHQQLSQPLTQDKKVNPTNNIQAYDELKRRLLNEYKKLTSNKKTFDDQVREKYKNLKQRGVSGKKNVSSTGYQLSNSVSQQQTGTAQQPLAQYQSSTNPPNQLSPKHHLNVYKPTFIINNSFGEGGTGVQGTQGPSVNKDADVVDQISKKYRPQSKSGSAQQSNSQTQIQQNSTNLGSKVSGRPSINQGPVLHERHASQYNHQIQNSQQLMGLLMNAEKKNPNAKKNMKTHALSQGQQDLNFVKQLLADKPGNTSMGKHQHQPSLQHFNQSSTGQNFAPTNQMHFATQQQFNQQPSKILMAQMDASHNKKPGSGQNTGAHKKPTGSGIQQNASVQSQAQKLAAYEKLKKKLSYHNVQPK